MDQRKVKLEARQIKKAFPGLDTLKEVSIKLEEKQLVSIIGPSGCGKSTLFDIISGLIHPDSGKVIIDGKEFTGKSGRVSYMHQKDLLLPWYTIIANVSLPLIIKGMDKKKSKETAQKNFSAFGLGGFEKNYPSQLSGGMRQRAALLRTYLFSEDIMLLDEPFGSLDAITRRKMQLWLLDILEKIEASMLFITHDIDEAIFLSDRIYLLSDRPAVVRQVFDIAIPRPRDNDTFTSDEFNEIKSKILKIL